MISIIGLGASSLGAASHEEMLKTLNHAFDAGINYVDLVAGHAPIFKAVGEALKVEETLFTYKFILGRNIPLENMVGQQI